MRMTNIEIHLTSSEVKQRDGVFAFVKITLDESILIRDLKILQHKGFLRLGMPSRKILHPCPSCRRTTDVTHDFCSRCGHRLPEPVGLPSKFHLDLVHPINEEFRIWMENEVAKAYNQQVNEKDRLFARSAKE
jgi:DNA-binding cell septation regulator SpoVG